MGLFATVWLQMMCGVQDAAQTDMRKHMSRCLQVYGDTSKLTWTVKSILDDCMLLPVHALL